MLKRFRNKSTKKALSLKAMLLVVKFDSKPNILKLNKTEK